MLAYAVLGLIAGRSGFAGAAGAIFIAERIWPIAAVLGASALFFVLHSGAAIRFQALAYPGLGVLILYLLSEVPSRPYGFFQNSGAGVILIVSGVLTAGAAWGLRRVKSSVRLARVRVLDWPLLLFVQVLLACCFLDLAQGRMLFSDDHPSFYYRLAQLVQQFPGIPFYSPDWEAGYSAREYFATGILNFFFLTAPLWYAAPDLSDFSNAYLYNYALLAVFVFLIPWAIYLSARSVESSHRAAIIAALLGLGPTLGFFEWLLKYGTLGFCCSVGFVPLAVHLCYRLILSSRPPPWGSVAALLVTSFFVISWTLHAAVFIPVVIGGAVCVKSALGPDRRWKVLTFLGLFLLLNVPWILIFIEASQVFSFVQGHTMPGVRHVASADAEPADPDLSEQEIDALEDGAQPDATSGASDIIEPEVTPAAAPAPPPRSLKDKVKRYLKSVRSLVSKINPLVLLLFIPGLVLIADRRLRWLLAGTVLWLSAVAVIGESFKPQLELKRMLITAAYLMIVPAALAIERLLEAGGNSTAAGGKGRALIEFGTLALIAGGIFVSVYTVSLVYRNKSDERFVFAPAMLPGFIEAIRDHGGDGRTFFFGFILHNLGASGYHSQNGGHVAPLALWTGKPLYAFFQMHSRWTTVDPIPEEHRRRGEEGIEEFLDLLNVTSVVTFKREWYVYCRSRDRYTQVYRNGVFRVFTRKSGSQNYFLSGKGRLEIYPDRLQVFPETSESVLKFRFHRSLKVDPDSGAEIFPIKAFEEETGADKQAAVEFIGVRRKISEELSDVPIAIGFGRDARAFDRGISGSGDNR